MDKLPTLRYGTQLETWVNEWALFKLLLCLHVHEITLLFVELMWISSLAASWQVISLELVRLRDETSKGFLRLALLAFLRWVLVMISQNQIETSAIKTTKWRGNAYWHSAYFKSSYFDLRTISNEELQFKKPSKFDHGTSSKKVVNKFENQFPPHIICGN